MTPLEAALAIADLWVPVFPCGSDKRPLTAHGFKSSTFEPMEVRAMWGRWPAALVGLPTGKASGLWVGDLDIDRLTGERIGEASVAAIGVPPPPWTAATRSGGTHWLYRYRDGLPGNTAGRLRGVDTRGDGGYIIAWNPSVILRALRDPALPEPPAALLEALARKPRPNGATYSFRPGAAESWAEAALDAEAAAVAHAPEGQRNHTLNVAAFNLGQIVAGGYLDQGRVEAELGRAAAACGLEAPEAERTIRSGLDAGMATPRGPRESGPNPGGPKPGGNGAGPKPEWEEWEDEPGGQGGERAADEDEPGGQGGQDQASGLAAADAFNPFTRISAPAFDPECWPDVVATYAIERRRATGADANGFACAAMQAMSVAIHPLTRLSMLPGGDWQVPPNLWIGIVGDSGANKSAVIKDNREHAQWREKRERARVAKEMEAIRLQFGEDEKAMKEAAEKIAPIRALAPDATVEAMQDLMMRDTQRGWGLQVSTDEMLRFLEAIDKYGPARHHWLCGHDCLEGHNVDRVKRGSVTVPVWAIGMFGGIQPKAMGESRLKPETDGLLQRFILCVLQPADLPDYGPTEGPPRSTPSRDAISDRIAASYARDQPSEFSLSIEAHHVRHAFMADNHALQRGLGDDPLSGFISKQRGGWGRVAMAFHVLQGETAGSPVSEETAERVTRFMDRFAYRHAGAFYDVLTGGAHRDDLAQAAGWLLTLQHEAGGGAIEITTGQMARGTQALRASSSNRARTNDTLEAGGWLHDLSGMPKSGLLKGRRWQMTPGLSARFAEERAAYLANLALVRARVQGTR